MGTHGGFQPSLQGQECRERGASCDRSLDPAGPLKQGPGTSGRGGLRTEPHCRLPFPRLQSDLSTSDPRASQTDPTRSPTHSPHDPAAWPTRGPGCLRMGTKRRNPTRAPAIKALKDGESPFIKVRGRFFTQGRVGGFGEKILKIHHPREGPAARVTTTA